MHEFHDDHTNTLCMLGATDFCDTHDYDSMTKGYDKVIVFNQEPMAVSHSMCLFDASTGGVDKKSRYFEWLRRADEVWDYDENNIAFLKTLGINARLHILKPYMDWQLFAPVDKDIDILFVGCVDKWPRRVSVIDFLMRTHNVMVIGMDNPVYGDILDSYILRSKILLNIHAASILQEQARMVRWIGAPCEIVSEKSAHNYLGVPEKEYWELFLL